MLSMWLVCKIRGFLCVFFFQAEDGIRDGTVTGVQTCALPISATVNTSFGSKVIVPGTGIFLNNQMDDFSTQPGVPNAFGLIGAEANAVAPGKRPLSSMSPTIVLRDGKPILAIGAAGGPTIISQTLLNLVNILDLGLSLDAALAQPRFHHQWQPDELRIENRAPQSLREQLAKLGHPLAPTDSIGASNGVAWSDGQFTA